jgi:hypothetical protein
VSSGCELSLREYLASFATAPGVISLLMFLVFGAMPTLVTWSTGSVPQRKDTAEAEDLWETDHWDAGHPYRHRV